MYAMLNLYKSFKTLNEIPHVIDFIFGHFLLWTRVYDSLFITNISG